jgi:hypothetical protein
MVSRIREACNLGQNQALPPQYIEGRWRMKQSGKTVKKRKSKEEIAAQHTRTARYFVNGL